MTTTPQLRRASEGRIIVELMETFLDMNRSDGEPEQPEDEPRNWIMFPRTVFVATDGTRMVLQDHVHSIEAPNLKEAQKQLREFVKGKVLSKEQW